MEISLTSTARGRVAQARANGPEYFLGDALGSVRQLVDAGGEVTLAQSYTPYGEVLATDGEATTSYAFTGEALDAYTGLVYLRARWYSSAQGRFITKDSWSGNLMKPMSFNGWNYVESNPVVFSDPTGHIKYSERFRAENIAIALRTFGIYIKVDWGEYLDDINPYESLMSPQKCGWREGVWGIKELELIGEAAEDLNKKMKGKILTATGKVEVKKIPFHGSAMAPPHLLPIFFGDITYLADLEYMIDQNVPQWDAEEWWKFTFVHEYGHVWDYKSGNQLSLNLMRKLGTWICETQIGDFGPEESCYWDPYDPTHIPTSGSTNYSEEPPDTPIICLTNRSHPDCKMPYSSTFGNGGPLFTGPGAEDWANTLGFFVYRGYRAGEVIGLTNGSIREKYVKKQISNLP